MLFNNVAFWVVSVMRNKDYLTDFNIVMVNIEVVNLQ